MIKKITQLKRRKGFTLVECIVAIAVFALLTAVILMILANAQNQAVISRESEEDLNNLVENVVGDDTYKKYSENSNTLTLNFGGGKTFDITYDTIAGYKNYVKCNPKSGATSCGYVGNNIDFMCGKTVADFLNDGDEYTCPRCGEVTTQTLVCEGCYTTGSYNDTSKFLCSSYTGSYTCLSCGGGSVKGNDIDDAVTADANFRISGLSANSIRYGKVDLPTDTKSLINTGGVNCNVTIEYEHKYDNLTLPGVYKMTFNAFSGGAPSSLDIYLPPWYVIGSLKTPASSGYTATAYQNDLSSKDVTDSNMSHIRINADSGNLPGTVIVEFTLTNYKNNYSFDYDYRHPYDIDEDGTIDSTEQNTRGLIGYWFRIGGNRTSSSTTYKKNANGDYTDIVTSDRVTLVSYPSGFTF
ncbi:MAG: type II secretion system protein [Ruminiclostridium sp.]